MLGTYGAGETFFTLKGELEAIFYGLRMPKATYTAVKDNPSFHPGRCAAVSMNGVHLGYIGQVHPLVAKNYGLDCEVYCAELDFDKMFSLTLPEPTYVPLPKYPTVTRDLSLVCDEAVTVADAENVITAAAGKLLRSVKLFDVYRGAGVPEGKKSVAFRVTLRASDRTLSDTEADNSINKLLKKLEAEYGIVMRA